MLEGHPERAERVAHHLPGAGADPADGDHEVHLRGVGEEREEVCGIVGAARPGGHRAAGIPQGLAEDDAVGVVDLAAGQALAGVADLVAGRDEQHPDAPENRNRGQPGAGENPVLGRTEPGSRVEEPVAGVHVAAGRAHERADRSGRAERDALTHRSGAVGVLRLEPGRIGPLDRHHGIRARRDRRTRHDRGGGARSQLPGGVAGGDPVRHGQDRRRELGGSREVFGAYGVPVHLRVVEGGQRHGGVDVCREDPGPVAVGVTGQPGAREGEHLGGAVLEQRCEKRDHGLPVLVDRARAHATILPQFAAVEPCTPRLERWPAPAGCLKGARPGRIVPRIPGAAGRAFTRKGNSWDTSWCSSS